MRTICHRAAIALVSLGSTAVAQDVGPAAQPIVIPSQSSLFNQNSINLPQAPIVTGQDIIRGADGTSCQSAVANSGPFLDIGVMQSEDVYRRDTAALYGRVVIPIGRRTERVDCTKLYELEIARMKMELEVLRMGVMVEGAGGLESPNDPKGLGAKFDAEVGGNASPSG